MGGYWEMSLYMPSPSSFAGDVWYAVRSKGVLEGGLMGLLLLFLALAGLVRSETAPLLLRTSPLATSPAGEFMRSSLASVDKSRAWAANSGELSACSLLG